MIRISKSVLAAAMLSIATFGSGAAFGADVMLKLSGANEVPAVTTSASGEGTLSVADDGAVSGSVMTKGSREPRRTSTWEQPARMGR